jgi:hypothetical protein
MIGSGSRRLALAAMVAAMSVIPATMRAQIMLQSGTWEQFFFYQDGSTAGFVGLVDGDFDGLDEFTFSSGTQTTLRVTDAFLTGDIFSVFVNGSSLFVTSTPGSDGVPTGTSDGASAWADASLSKGEALLAPGDYTVTIRLSAMAAGNSLGEGFLMFEPFDDGSQTVVPEPGTMVLLGSGLAGLAAARRRRRQNDSA